MNLVKSLFNVKISLAVIYISIDMLSCDINKIMETQTEVSNSSSNKSQTKITIAGTNWCGPGNNFLFAGSDLGYFAATDMCCMAHDLCEHMSPGESKFNLTNISPFTRMKCRCDQTLLNCLRESNNKKSKEIGLIYFGLYGIVGRCFDETHPAKCRKRRLRRCVDYVYNYAEPMVYQWFDLPLWKDNKQQN